MAASDDASERQEAFRRVFAEPESLRIWLDEALPYVYGFVFARCGADEAVAQDIAQETMVEVVRHRASFDGRAEALTWVCGIARHKVADHVRRKYREERRRLRLVESAPSEVEEPEAEAMTHQAVVETLRALPEGQRVALAMHYLDGYSVREIAERLERSESAVESLLTRGREGFKKHWARGEEAG